MTEGGDLVAKGKLTPLVGAFAQAETRVCFDCAAQEVWENRAEF